MKNATQIVVVLDKSGSMDSVRTDTIGGFNTFIEDQKKLTGECNVSLVTFNDKYQNVFINKPVNEVELLTESMYSPDGYTALLDAVGATIDKLGNELAAMKEEDRPNKIVFVIMTDGVENASREYTYSQIKEKITHQQDKYGWMFTFIGANIDAIQGGASIGIGAANSVNYCANVVGTQNTFNVIKNKMSAVRGSSSAAEASLCMSYSADERSLMSAVDPSTSTKTPKTSRIKTKV